MFIYRQIINFIPPLFLEILLSYYKFILDTLGMPGYIYQKQYNQLVRKFIVYIQSKNQFDPMLFFLRYYTLKNPAIWLTEIISTASLKIRIFPGKDFVVKYK